MNEMSTTGEKNNMNNDNNEISIERRRNMELNTVAGNYTVEM